jgi:2-C-methyl-D-erythritol 4-phosphate cytidylyltransferase
MAAEPGAALVWVEGDAPLRLRVAGSSPLSRILAALRSVPVPLEIEVEQPLPDRAASLRAALERVPDARFFIIWDASRPLAGTGCIESLVAGLDRHPAVVVGAPVKATIKRTDGDVISGGVPREGLLAIGGPRAYRRAALELASARAEGAGDDLDGAQLAGIPLAPLFDEVAAMPVRDEDDARLAERLLALTGRE